MRTIFHYTDSSDFGGAEQALLTLMAKLDRQHWRSMLVYHPTHGLEPLLEGARQLEVDLWPVPRMRDGLEGARRAPQFVRELRARRPDVFHANLTWPLACKFGLASAIFARVPAIVATVHLFVEFPLDLSIFVQQRLIAAGVGRYIAVSHDVAQRLQKKLHWPAQKIQVIHNSVAMTAIGCPTHEPRPDHLLERDDRPMVLTVARLVEQKGHQYLLEAAAQVPEAQFVLAGDGPLRASLEAQAQLLGLERRVKFLGYRTDIPDLLARCDVFVLPSLYEGLPLSILEAMSVGKPVIATQVGGTDEAVISAETGLLVPPADSSALATAIRSVLADRSLAKRLAQAGRMRAGREFSTAAMVRQVTNVYDELLGRHEASYARR